MSRWSAEISGPISVSSDSGSPTRIACTAVSSWARKSSSTERSTRIRERAQQSCPALPNIPPGAAAAAAAMSASAKTTLADLPPSSSVTRLIVCAAPAAIRRPTSVDPVKATLATSGCSTRRCPHVEPGPATTFSTPSGRPASSASSAKRSALSGVSSAGFSTTVLPGGQRRPELPRRDRQREVPRRDHRDDAERLAERHRHAAAHRDRVAEQPLGCAGVVAEGVDDHAHLAARVADRLAGVARLERRELLEVLLDDRRDATQQPRAVRRGDGPPRGPGRDRARDGGVRLLDARAGNGVEPTRGGRLDHFQHWGHRRDTRRRD